MRAPRTLSIRSIFDDFLFEIRHREDPFLTADCFEGSPIVKDEDHVAGLMSIYQCFGDVRTTDEVMDELIPLSGEASQAAE